MSLLRRMAEIMSARSALRRSAAAALSGSIRADQATIATAAGGAPASSSPPAASSAWHATTTATASRYYSPYASAAAAEAAASASASAAASPTTAAAATSLRPAPPPPGQTPQRPPLPPWTPTHLLAKRKRPQKRMRALMQHLEREHVERAAAQKTQLLMGGGAGAAGTTTASPPPFPARKGELPRAGDVVEIRTVVPEAGRKVYTYKGVCLGRANKGPRSWIKMYNVFPDAGGVVQHLPM